VDGEAGALRRGIDQLQRPPGSPGQAVEHWMGSFAPDERHVLLFFSCMYMGALGPALQAAVSSACQACHV
jgi:hypothetical protein